MLSTNLVIKFKILSWFFPCKKCQIEATSLCLPVCSFLPKYSPADWPLFQTMSHSAQHVVSILGQKCVAYNNYLNNKYWHPEPIEHFAKL